MFQDEENHETRIPEKDDISFKHFYCCVRSLNDFMLLNHYISN